MNINLFFISVFTALMVVFVFFKPMKLKQKITKEVANVETYAFVMHQLDTKGLVRIVKGKEAFVYKDRYNVKDIDYTDATKNKRINIKADDGIYKDRTIHLLGHVVYKREDGLVFKSQSLKYNEKTSIAKTDDKYVIYRDKDKINGISVLLDNKLDKIYSKDVDVVYDIKGKI